MIERARTLVVPKPWGSNDLRPWSDIHDHEAIGEIWFQRADREAPAPALLLKLLFANEQLSIQVHPDDAFAKSLGLAHGKSEAWYILSALPGAQIAIGLTRQLDTTQLRAAIEDGSIAVLVKWRDVSKGDVIFVPAGTIHSIGPGVVIAEIQQRSEATFRLFDHGRQRELHVDNAVAATRAGPADRTIETKRLTRARDLLITSPYFVLERIDLAPKSHWTLRAKKEAWLFVLAGHARINQMDASIGEAFFAKADDVNIEVGTNGLKALLAYAGPDLDPDLPSPPFGDRAMARTPFITMEAK